MSLDPGPVPRLTMDGRVTVALLVTLALEAVAALIWIGAAAQRLDVLEARFDAQAGVVERLARLEAQMTAARASLDRIESNLDREAGR